MEIPQFSRLTHTPTYSDKSGEFFAPWQDTYYFDSRSDDLIARVTPDDNLRPDLVSYKLYGTTDFWWLVCRLLSVANPLDGIAEVDRPATTPVLLSTTGVPMLKMSTKSFGDHLNSGSGYSSLVIRVSPGASPSESVVEVIRGILPGRVPVSGSLSPEFIVETFTASGEFLADNFWPYTQSRELNVTWIPTAGEQEPLTLKPGVYPLSGGHSARAKTVRFPSLAQVMEKLSA